MKTTAWTGWSEEDNNKTSHQTSIEHSLGVIPDIVTIEFTTDKDSSSRQLVQWSWEKNSSGNPVSVTVTTTQIILNIVSGSPLNGTWSPVGSWDKYSVGYWRVSLISITED